MSKSNTDNQDIHTRLGIGEDPALEPEILDFIFGKLAQEGFTNFGEPYRKSYADKKLQIDWFFPATRPDGTQADVMIGMRCKESTRTCDWSGHGNELQAWQKNKIQPEFYFSGKTKKDAQGKLSLVDKKLIRFNKFGFDDAKIQRYRNILNDMAHKHGKTVVDAATKAQWVTKEMYVREVHDEREFWVYPQRPNKHVPYKLNGYFIEPYSKYPGSLM